MAGPLDLHVVLLAGGSGTRFWPWSRRSRPKQFLPLGGEGPLILATWRRARRLVPARKIWVVTPAELAPAVLAALPDLGKDRLILEPAPRNTGPAVTLACLTVERAHPGALVAVFPTDHLVRDVEAFARAVEVARRSAARGALVCLGIAPDRPATGFGWLECARPPSRRRAVPVRRFVEKPDLARARRFLRSGRHLWNAGIFLWLSARFISEAERVSPALVRAARGHLEGRARAWDRAPRLSVDHAVMERASDVEVVALDAGWEDLGSWDAAARFRETSGAPGRPAARIVRVDSPGSHVFSDGPRLTALVGVPGVVVVESDDALLVISRASAERVRSVVEALQAKGARKGTKDLL